MQGYKCIIKDELDARPTRNNYKVINGINFLVKIILY